MSTDGHHHTQEELTTIHDMTTAARRACACLACDSHHHHHHHHDHDADEVFTSWGRETPRKYSREELQDALSALAMGGGLRLYPPCQGHGPLRRRPDLAPLRPGPRRVPDPGGRADYTGRLCVIGSELNEDQAGKAVPAGVR